MDKPLVQQGLVAAQVEAVLDEIFEFCSDAVDARRAALEGSAEWHKRTGEILAYGRMTSLLSRLEKAANTSGETSADETPNCVSYRENTYVVLSLTLLD